MIRHADSQYGPHACRCLTATTGPSPDGVYAGLESFCFTLNQRDAPALRDHWTNHPVAQLKQSAERNPPRR